MSILKKIKALKKEQNAHLARINALQRKEQSIICARMNNMFLTFLKYIEELDGETVEGFYIKVRGDSRSILLFAGGIPIVQFSPRNEFVPCHCESMCNCKNYRYEIIVTPAEHWRKDARIKFTIETISEQEAFDEDETAKCILQIIQDWNDNYI